MSKTLPGTLTFLSRADWQAAAPTRAPLQVPAHDRLGVAVHWEGPKMAQPVHADCPGLVRQIQHFHQAADGWSDIAYSFVVCQHGVVFRGRGWAWDQFANGTTTDAALQPDDTGYANRHWYSAVVLIGEGEQPTQAAIDALARIVRRARRRGAGDRVVPHRDFHPTDCPGDTLAAVAHKWDRAQLPAGAPAPQQPRHRHHHHAPAPVPVSTTPTTPLPPVALEDRVTALEASVHRIERAAQAAAHAAQAAAAAVLQETGQ